MRSASIKKELHKSIDAMPDENFLKAVYDLFKSYSGSYNSDLDLSTAEKKALDKDRKNFKAGKGRNYSVAETRRSITGSAKK